MKSKVLAALIFVVTPLAIAYGVLGIGNIQSDVIIVKQHGGKNYATLTSVVTRLGSVNKTLVFDGGGTWSITNSYAIPTNFNVYVARDTILNISTTMLLRINGYIDSGDWQIFGGPGMVTGPVDNPWVHDGWTAHASNAPWLDTVFTSYAPSIVGISNAAYHIRITNEVVANIGISNAAQTTVITQNHWSVHHPTQSVEFLRMTNWPSWFMSASFTDGDGNTGTMGHADGGYYQITNMTQVSDHTPYDYWDETNSTFYPKRPGVWHVFAEGSFNAMTNGFTAARLYVRQNKVDTNQRLIDSYRGTNTLTFRYNGSTMISETGYAGTNSWAFHVYYEGTGNGGVSNVNGRFFITYAGNPLLPAVP